MLMLDAPPFGRTTSVVRDGSHVVDAGDVKTSCVQCARLLETRRDMYEDLGVFPKEVIDHQIGILTKENDEHLNSDFAQLPAEERLTATRELMHKDIHRH